MAKRGRKSLEEKGLVSEAIVRDLYETKSLSANASAKQIGISVGAFNRYMKQYGVESRSRGNRRSKSGEATVQSAPEQGSFESHVSEPGIGFDGD